MKALKRIKKYLSPSTARNLDVQDQNSAAFLLMLDDLHVGTLSYDKGDWLFQYSEDFRETQGIKTLADFPDANKNYKSEVLWPFFISRIPSLSRKRFKKVVEQQGIAENDLLGLLAHFGRRTITNPFELMAVD